MPLIRSVLTRYAYNYNHSDEHNLAIDSRITCFTHEWVSFHVFLIFSDAKASRIQSISKPQSRICPSMHLNIFSIITPVVDSMLKVTFLACRFWAF